MAERRMFAKAIISSGKFLRMPPTARLLYYDLGMQADDDGIVEAYTIMAQTKATEDDLRILIAKGYVQILNEELVTLICDWNTNNTIRSDRYHPSIYKDLVLRLGTTDNQLTTTWQPSVNQVTTKCQPNDNQMETEVRLGKVSIVKDSIDKVSIDNKYIVVCNDCIDYLNQQLGTSYKGSSKKTRSLVNARCNEGYTLDDFIKVIDNKVDEWRGTDMEKYLRPETLFGTKFESYLNQKPKNKQVGVEASLSKWGLN